MLKKKKINLDLFSVQGKINFVFEKKDLSKKKSKVTKKEGMDEKYQKMIQSFNVCIKDDIKTCSWKMIEEAFPDLPRSVVLILEASQDYLRDRKNHEKFQPIIEQYLCGQMKKRKLDFLIDKPLRETLKTYAAALMDDGEDKEEILRYASCEEITFWKPKSAFINLEE